MFKEVDQAVTFVIMFLPGVVASAIFFHVADVRFTEFYFVVASIIFGILNTTFLIICLSALQLLGRLTQRKFKMSVWKYFISVLRPHHLVVPSTILSIASSSVFAYAYDEGLILRAANIMPIAKQHHDRPIHYMLRIFRFDGPEQNAQIRGILERRSEDHYGNSEAVYVRVYDKGNHNRYYEGVIAIRPTKRDPLELFLAAACAFEEGRGLEPIRGPGVFIGEDHVGNMKLIDVEYSECARYWWNGEEQHDSQAASVD